MPPEELFPLRYAIARIGEWDWLKWWESNALGSSGQYAATRLFGRTARLSGAHLAILAARSRHDASMPQEPRIHLFDLGEIIEARFERWLAREKADGWEPRELPRKPDDAQCRSVISAISAVGLVECEAPRGVSSGRKSVAVGTMTVADLSVQDGLRKSLHSLVGAYQLSSPGEFIAPYLRLRVQ